MKNFIQSPQISNTLHHLFLIVFRAAPASLSCVTNLNHAYGAPWGPTMKNRSVWFRDGLVFNAVYPLVDYQNLLFLLGQPGRHILTLLQSIKSQHLDIGATRLWMYSRKLDLSQEESRLLDLKSVQVLK